MKNFCQEVSRKESRGRLGSDGRRKIMFLRKTGYEGMNWSHLARAKLEW